MGQRHVEPGDAPTIEQVTRRLEAEDVADVARATFDCVGELAALECGSTAAALAACRLASRRTRREPLTCERMADTFDVDPEHVADAEATIASYLTPPADADDVRALRRTLIVAHELLDAVERDRLHALELPGSYLADAAPWLLGRTQRSIESRDDDRRGLDEDELRAHVERLEADLELARLGTLLYADVDDVRGE
ncbi:hypothetical protein [Natrialba sp. INN-245]|uniref:hypothetical protein n=1 Tax=Natrialba sp. INN-245 TaxID=2690967 RepID=UPI001310789F|nr:hypothetical protein [Natrialba sp. INN-245]MWV40846.1 hypothetical protein [Natrialba sp. INN-245]